MILFKPRISGDNRLSKSTDRQCYNIILGEKIPKSLDSLIVQHDALVEHKHCFSIMQTKLSNGELM
jgi:hypothetical protein